MIYLVSNQKQLFDSEEYKMLSPKDALDMIHSWERVQFDTETTGRNPHVCNLLCSQFGNKKADTQIVVDNSTVDFKLYESVFTDKLIIGHNLKFDCQFCYKYKVVPSKVWDTMIIEQLLHLGYDAAHIKYSLQAVEERRLNKFLDKSTRGEIIWRGLDTKVIKYAAGDVTDLEDIMELQIEDCNNSHCIQGAKLENAFVPVIAYLEWCGVKLDVEKWKAIMSKNELQKEEALSELTKWLWDWTQEHTSPGYTYEEVDLMKPFSENKIKKLEKQHFAQYKHEKTIDSDIYYYRKWVDNPYFEKQLQGDLFLGYNDEPICTMNWNSQNMVIPLLQQMGFKTKTEDKKTGESKESMVEKLIKKQKGINDEFINLYYGKYQKSVKVCSTYGQQYIDAINPITNRIHTTFKQLGASSGRMSCGNSTASDTDLAKYKGIPASRCKFVQLQNLPSDDDTRSSFIPDVGNLMCSCDYSALESRLGADIYNEPSMIKEYLEGSGDKVSVTLHRNM